MHTQSRNQAFVAGTMLIVVTLLAAFAMAHHPTVGRTIDTEHAIEKIVALSRSSALVHGALIAAMLLTLHCIVEFALVRGFHRPLIRAGAIAYAAGVVVMIGAALVSGFLVSDVASSMPQATPADLQVDRQVLILCALLNRTCADFGAVAMSAGIALWSVDLLRDRGIVRVVGLFGCVVGVVPIIALLMHAIRLDVHGMLAVVLLQAAWNLAIGALLIRSGRGAGQGAEGVGADTKHGLR